MNIEQCFCVMCLRVCLLTEIKPYKSAIRIRINSFFLLFSLQILLGYTLTMAEIKQQLVMHRQSAKNYHDSLDILEIPNLTTTETKGMKMYFTNYCKAHGNSLCIYYHPFGNYDTNWDDALQFTNWIATNRETLNEKHCLTSVTDVILVKWRTCELGLRYDIEIISKGNHGIEFTAGKLYTMLQRICTEQADFSGKVYVGIFSDESYTNEINSTVMSVLGEKHSASPVKIYHVYEELQI